MPFDIGCNPLPPPTPETVTFDEQFWERALERLAPRLKSMVVQARNNDKRPEQQLVCGTPVPFKTAIAAEVHNGQSLRQWLRTWAAERKHTCVIEPFALHDGDDTGIRVVLC